MVLLIDIVNVNLLYFYILILDYSLLVSNKLF